MPQGDPPPRVYAAGFLRKDGKGYFWHSMIKMPDGRLLSTPQQAITLLMKVCANRNGSYKRINRRDALRVNFSHRHVNRKLTT
jgi:hypothetical protein